MTQISVFFICVIEERVFIGIIFSLLWRIRRVKGCINTFCCYYFLYLLSLLLFPLLYFLGFGKVSHSGWILVSPCSENRSLFLDTSLLITGGRSNFVLLCFRRREGKRWFGRKTFHLNPDLTKIVTDDLL